MRYTLKKTNHQPHNQTKNPQHCKDKQLPSLEEGVLPCSTPGISVCRPSRQDNHRTSSMRKSFRRTTRFLARLSLQDPYAWPQLPTCPCAFGPEWAGRQQKDAIAPVTKFNAVFNALSQRIVTKLAFQASFAKRVKLHSSCFCPHDAFCAHSLPEL